MLFNMLILGSLIDESGYIFHRSETDLYIVETTLPNDKDQVCNLVAANGIRGRYTSSKVVYLLKKSQYQLIHKRVLYSMFYFVL